MPGWQARLCEELIVTDRVTSRKALINQGCRFATRIQQDQNLVNPCPSRYKGLIRADRPKLGWLSGPHQNLVRSTRFAFDSGHSSGAADRPLRVG